jgi:3-hydroxyacyl-CoA dehydrogenase
MNSARREAPADEQKNPKPLLVRRAAVLGAGTMGARIAAHLANAGIPVLLLDLPGEPGRPQPAQAALEALAKAKPAAFFSPSLAAFITPGSFDADLPRLADCDWVVEAVAEKLEIKTALLQRIIEHLKPEAVLTTNTSGLPIARIAEAVGSGEWRRRFFGTHFFNPPRYMRLLEIIPTAESDPAVVASFAAFADLRLGKQVVRAHDTPNFIANRIGVATMFRAARLLQQQGLTIEEVDALTGPALGWPRTGTFRLADLVGIDVLAQVAANFPAGAESGGFGELLAEMVRRGWLGDKAVQGFYRKSRGADGKEERLALDLRAMDYRPSIKPALATLELAKNGATVADRLRVLLSADPRRDKAAAFLWPFLAGLWSDAADRIGDAADDAPSIDRALRAGFNWELGPFELWDAVGVAASLERMRAQGLAVSPRAEALLAAGQSSWYAASGRACFQPSTGQQEVVAIAPGHARVADYRRANGIVRGNPGASLVDLGSGADGVRIGCIELHSMKNAIGGDVLSLVTSVLRPDADAVRDFDGFVLTGDRDNFTVGANLMQLLLIAQEGEWEEIAAVIRGFQQMTAAIKFCPRPVVVAPFGLTLGGGAEICLHAPRRQPHAETYMGLVETGVGLIPAGGGTKEMLLRALDAAAALATTDPRDPPSRFAQSAEVQSALKRAFETIALAKVSTSAAEARSMGFLAATEGITMNRERLLEDAKAQAALLAAGGYAPPPMRTIPAPGIAALAVLEMAVSLMGEAGYASEHDRKVSRRMAQVLCGGRVTPGTLVSEQDVLDLELEAFLSLCGERKTQERIAYTLKTGKPLRN